jgi:hypothetical protein
MSKDDVLFGYRCQVFDLAGRNSVSHACRTFVIHRSTYVSRLPHGCDFRSTSGVGTSAARSS